MPSMRLKVRLVIHFVFGAWLALPVGCVEERRTSEQASSASVTSADTRADSQIAAPDPSRAPILVDSLAIRAPIPTVWPPPKVPQCADSVDVFDCFAVQVEKPTLATTGIRVNRVGDTLRVNTNARTLMWIDSKMIGEGSARHFYAGTISTPAGKRYAVVQHDLYEDSPYVLIDWVTGDTVRVPDRPVLSPDSNRIVAGEFSEDGRLEIEVWNLGSARPTREFAKEWDGTGPVDIVWRDNRTINFRLRQTSGGRESVPTPIPMVLTREQDSTWRLAPRR